MLKDEPVGKTSQAEQRALAGTQEKKKKKKKRKVSDLWKKRQATRDNYKDVMRFCREEVRRDKAQLELNLITVVKDNKKCFYTFTTKGELRRISILYWMRGKT